MERLSFSVFIFGFCFCVFFFIFAVTPALAATDAHADAFLRIFQGITAKIPTNWRSNPLADWYTTDSKGKKTDSCPIDSGTQLYRCSFSFYGRTNQLNSDLYGNLPADMPLQHLTIDGFNTSWRLQGNFDLNALPTALTKFVSKFSNAMYRTQLDVTRLPPNMTHFEVSESYLGSKEIANMSSWPASMKTIKFHKTSAKGTWTFADLPRGLTTLYYAENNFDCNLTSASLAELPPQLEVFEAQQNKRGCKGPIGDLSLAPRSLKTWKMGGYQDAGGELTGLTNLPPGLENFALFETQVTGNVDLTRLPATLTNLNLQKNNLGPAPVQFGALPCIKDLRLAENKLGRTGNAGLDMRPFSKCIEYFDIQKNYGFVGPLILPAQAPTDWALKTWLAGWNKLEGTLANPQLPVGKLVRLDINNNIGIDSMTCWRCLPDTMTHLNFNDCNVSLSDDDEIDLGLAPPKISQLHMQKNRLRGSQGGNLTRAPRSLYKYNAGYNQLTGEVDLRGMPTAMDHFSVAGNRFMRLYPFCGDDCHHAAADFVVGYRLKYFYVHRNRELQGPLVGRIPKSMVNFYVSETAMGPCCLDDFFLTWLGKERNKALRKFYANKAGFTGSYMLNLQNLPSSLQEFSLQDQHSPAFSDTKIRMGRGGRNNVPWKWRHGWKNLNSFCSLVTKGNNVMEFWMCNSTLTRSATLFSRSATHSLNGTRSRQGSESLTLTETLVETPTHSRTGTPLDPTGLWMLTVVLKDIEGLPRDKWSLFPMRQWECERYSAADPTKVETALCCPAVQEQDTGRWMHRCSFTAPQVRNGTVDVRFPKAYPMSSFSFTDSPEVGGTVALDQMPDTLQELVVERTGVATSLHFGSLPAGMRRISLCDNTATFVTDFSFGGMSPKMDGSLKSLRLCGGQVWMGHRSFRFGGLPQGLEELVLSRLAIAGALPDIGAWELPASLQSLDLSGNRFDEDITRSKLFRSSSGAAAGEVQRWRDHSNLTFINVSGNLLQGSDVHFGHLIAGGGSSVPFELEVLDASHNLLAGEPNFSEMVLTMTGKEEEEEEETNNTSNSSSNSTGSTISNKNKNETAGGLVELHLAHNRFAKHDLLLGTLPPSLRRLVLRGNAGLRGRFEVAKPLPWAVKRTLEFFCYTDIFPGTGFVHSMTCGDRTLSKSLSLSIEHNSTTIEKTKSLTATLEGTDSRHRVSETGQGTASRNSRSPTRSDSAASNTEPSGRSPSRTLLATRSETNESSPSETLTFTRTLSLPVPRYVHQRDPYLEAAMAVGAAVAVLAAPALPAAATLVSRQTAIARAFGGVNNTCGGPSRADPLAFFEDPLGLDLDPLERDCTGYLAGVFIGNVIIGLAIPFFFWLCYALHFLAKTKRIPGFFDGADNRWPGEVCGVFTFGLLLPPAVMVMVVSASRCSWGIGGAVSAFTLLSSGFAVYHFMWRRERHERCCPTVYFVPRAQRCFRIKRAVQYFFAPAGCWVWKPFERLKRHTETQQQEASGSGECSIQQHQQQQERPLLELPDDVGSTAPPTPREQSLDAQQQQQEQQPGPRPSGDETKEEEDAQKEMQEEDQQRHLTEEEKEAAEHDRNQEQRYDTVQRWLDKYRRKSWWFLAFEFGIRGVMSLGPGIAEAVPPQYSCLVLRLIYLLCVNTLLFSLLARRPTLHRALFFAILIATVTEITVLVLLLAGFGDEQDTKGGLLSVMMQVSQYFALVLILGVELYEFLLERCFVWARGEVLLPPRERRKRKPDGKKKNGDDDDDGEDGEDEEEDGDSETDAQEMQVREMEARMRLGDEDAEMSASSGAAGSFGRSGFATVSGATKRRIGLEELTRQQEEADKAQREREEAARAKGISKVHEDTDGELFDLLDRRVRQAYKELLHEDVEVVEPAQRYQSAKMQLEEYMDL